MNGGFFGELRENRSIETGSAECPFTVGAEQSPASDWTGSIYGKRLTAGRGLRYLRSDMSEKTTDPSKAKDCPRCAELEEKARTLEEKLRLQTMFVDSLFDLLEEKGIINANPTLGELFKIFKDEDSLNRALSPPSPPSKPSQPAEKIIDLGAARSKKQGS